jgi:hypothetical protein
MKNADPAVIEFITARSANYPVAGNCLPHTIPSQNKRSAPPSCTTCTPLLHPQGRYTPMPQGKRSNRSTTRDHRPSK